MPNNPPLPVIELLHLLLPEMTKCEVAKAAYGIETRPHGNGANRNGKRVPGDKGKESHHILQDKAMEALVPREDGQAVLLCAAKDDEHKIINKLQRDRNCPPGTGTGGGHGPSTFGALKASAKSDLSAGLQGGERNVPKEDADIIADCLVAEAEKEANKTRKKKGETPLKDSDPVLPVKGCLDGDILVWLDDSVKAPAKDLSYEHSIITKMGRTKITRIDACNNVMYKIKVCGEFINISASHRVQLAMGQYIRVDSLKVGHELSTAFGKKRLESIERISGCHNAYNFGIGRRDACRIGQCGLWAELSDIGPEIVGEECIENSHFNRNNQCPN